MAMAPRCGQLSGRGVRSASSGGGAMGSVGSSLYSLMRSTDTICVSISEDMRTIQFSVCVTDMAVPMLRPAIAAKLALVASASLKTAPPIAEAAAAKVITELKNSTRTASQRFALVLAK